MWTKSNTEVSHKQFINEWSFLQTYLSDEDFQSIFKVDRENFYKQPVWKQRDMKKRVNLF